ncbi:rna-directed dna polymerase from mobile element jockey-like [Willisornis vidua]|uniref:Rna-directed dna polymerase from mobile element jockey-like n=1 Tax=Willisornis vidua TaxID=1566151 RepID=A0ABQ9CLI2_9PASS|nr:rna-directed dna polymerase from mobile element jockey-like [Willisornis vidua]
MFEFHFTVSQKSWKELLEIIWSNRPAKVGSPTQTRGHKKVSRLCGAVDRLKGKDAIQRDLDRLQRWACVNLMKFNKAKGKVLHQGQGNPKHKYRNNRECVKTIPWEKGSGLLVDRKLDMSQ